MVTMAIAFRHAEDPFYYANGEKLYWQTQYDMYAFRTVGDLRFNAGYDSSVVDRIEFRGNYPDKLNLLFFSPNSSNWQRLQVIDDIQNHITFNREFPVVTMFDNTPSEEGLWYVADDLIMVMFKNDSIAQAHLPRILDEYGLNQINDPSNLPAGGTYAYILKWDTRDLNIINSVELSRQMYERDSAVLWSVEPNLIRGYEPVWVEDTDTMSTSSPSLHSESSAATLYVVSQGDVLNVYFKTREPQYLVRVYDLFGRMLIQRHQTANDTQADINTSHLSGGIYFATLETNNGEPFATVKFLK